RRLDARRGRALVAVDPHAVRGAEGEAAGREGEAHGALEGAEVRVELVAVRPDRDEVTALVGGDEEGDPELVEDPRQVLGVDAAQGRLGPARRGGGDGGGG